MHVFDAHFQIFDPRFLLVPNRGFTLRPFRVQGYLSRTPPLAVWRGSVVAASFQGKGLDWLLAVLARLGPGWVGVA